MFNLSEIYKELLQEDIRNKTGEILKALRNHNLCTFTVYNSEVPGYGSSPEQRFGVILAYGIGRFENEPCIRVFQTNKNASWGTPRNIGSDYKILYLKDILDIRLSKQTITSPPPKFNPDEDKWMTQTIEVAKWKGFRKTEPQQPKASDVYKTDTERELQKQRDNLPSMKMDITGQSKTQGERYKQVQTLSNRALAVYRKVLKTGTPEAIEQARNKYREIQSIANKYMAGYKKEKRNKI
jgi:hypothetical protein